MKVIVVGSGPAGSACAIRLSEAGHEVVVLEKRKVAYRKPCGEYLCPTGVEELRKLNIDLSPYPAVHSMRILSPKGVEVNCPFPGAEPHKKQAVGLSINRGFFDEELRQISVKFGAKLLRGEELCTIEKGTKGWKLKCKSGLELNADLLIGADGRGSRVASLLGVTRAGNKRIAIHALVADKTPKEGTGEMHILSGGSYLGINPVCEIETNLTLVMDGSKVNRGERPIEILKKYVEMSPSLAGRFDWDHVSGLKASYPLEHRVKNIHGEGWALLGDAAGFYDPLTGEGMYSALLTARILSEELLQEQSMSRALGRYARRRRKLFLEKSLLNRGFQSLLARPKLCDRVARFLNAQASRPETFIGMVGNLISPCRGIFRLALAR